MSILQNSYHEFMNNMMISLHASPRKVQHVARQPSLWTIIINHAIPLLAAVVVVLGLIPVAVCCATSQWPHWLLSFSFAWSGSCRVGEEGCSFTVDWWWEKRRRRCGTCQRYFEPGEHIFSWIDNYCPQCLNRLAPTRS